MIRSWAEPRRVIGGVDHALDSIENLVPEIHGDSGYLLEIPQLFHTCGKDYEEEAAESSTRQPAQTTSFPTPKASAQKGWNSGSGAVVAQ